MVWIFKGWINNLDLGLPKLGNGESPAELEPEIE